MDYDKKAEELIEKVKSLKDSIISVRGLKDAAELLPEIVKAVEAAEADEEISGSDKKKLAVTILNRLIDIPFLPEAVEGMLIGWAIDAIVTALNKLFGKDWLAKTA